MDKLWEKLALYDFLVRLLTGVTVILMAGLFGFYNAAVINIPIWGIFVFGYFCGIILEEVSFWFEKLLDSRKKVETKVCSDDKYQNYDYEKCKAALFADGQSIIADEPLTHIVMSRSYIIAFAFFLLLEIVDAVCCNDLISGSFICPVVDMVILIGLIVIFHLRARHYSKRRTRQIFDFCISKKYTNIEKEDAKTDKTNNND